MFKRKHEVTEGELLRDALRHKETRIIIAAADGRRWTLVNDTAAECTCIIDGIVIQETPSKQDIITSFRVKAKNGRVG